MDLALTDQPFYAGEFRHQIDDKNRVTIPSRWRRNGEPEDFLILPDPASQFLIVMSPDEFTRISASASSAEGVSPRDVRVFLRQLHSRAQHGSSDKQGRLVLPLDLCKQVDLKGEVVLVGGRARFEIWNLQRWQRAHEEEHSTFQHVANLVGL